MIHGSPYRDRGRGKRFTVSLYSPFLFVTALIYKVVLLFCSLTLLSFILVYVRIVSQVTLDFSNVLWNYPTINMTIARVFRVSITEQANVKLSFVNLYEKL